MFFSRRHTRLAFVLAVSAVAVAAAVPPASAATRVAWSRAYPVSGRASNAVIAAVGSYVYASALTLDATGWPSSAVLTRWSRSGRRQWTRTLDRPGVSDWVNAIDVDARDGAALVVGDFGSGLRKYRSDGSVAWSRTLSVTHPKDVEVDSSGNVYVVGTSGDRDFVVKYSSGGTLLWSRTLIPAGLISFGIAAMDVRSGSIAVTGHTGYDLTGSGGGGFYLGVLRTTDGSTAWLRQGSAYEWINDIAIDGQRRIVATAAEHFFARQYSAGDGTLLWTAPGVFAGLAHNGGGVAVDTGGNALVAGLSIHADTAYNPSLTRLTPAGGRRWSFEWSARCGQGTLSDVASDGSGGGFVVGIDCAGNETLQRVFVARIVP